MKAILLEDVKSLGKKGEVVNVVTDMQETSFSKKTLDWKQMERI